MTQTQVKQTQEWVEIERGAYKTQTQCNDIEIDVIVTPNRLLKDNPGRWVFGFAINDQLIKHQKRNYPSNWSFPIKRLGQAKKKALKRVQYLQILKCEECGKAMTEIASGAGCWVCLGVLCANDCAENHHCEE